MIHQQAVRILQQIIEDRVMHLQKLPAPQMNNPAPLAPIHMVPLWSLKSEVIGFPANSPALLKVSRCHSARPPTRLPCRSKAALALSSASALTESEGSPFLRGERGKLPVLPASQAPAHASDPQRALRIPQQRLHRPGLKSFRQTERDKSGPVESAHPGIAAHPKVTILGLGQRAHEILRQPLLALPHPERERHWPRPMVRPALPDFIPLSSSTKSLNEVAMAISLNVHPSPRPPWRRRIWLNEALAANFVVRLSSGWLRSRPAQGPGPATRSPGPCPPPHTAL
jgi:hypothetical protein